MKILIAEDEKSIANSLRKNFIEEGHDAIIAEDGEMALNMISNNEFDTILLDWRMPKLTGIEVCRKLRASGFKKAIILITALSDISNKIEALNTGADDYITKPFSFDEVMARINAVLRRYNSFSPIVKCKDFEINILTRILSIKNENIKLPDKEFELLKYFLDNKGQIISKDILCKDVWNLSFTPETNFVEVTLKNLRKKLEDKSENKYIKTVYGEGYIFLAD